VFEWSFLAVSRAELMVVGEQLVPTSGRSCGTSKWRALPWSGGHGRTRP